MRELVDDLKTALPAVFQGEDYQSRRGAIDQAFQSKQQAAFAAFHEKAAAKNIAMVRTPTGFTLAPLQNGKIVLPDEFNGWPDNRRHEIQELIQGLETELEQVIRQIPRLEMERRDDIRKLNRDTARFAVSQSIDEARSKFTDLPQVTAHLEAARTDLVDNAMLFVMKADADMGQVAPVPDGQGAKISSPRPIAGRQERRGA